MELLIMKVVMILGSEALCLFIVFEDGAALTNPMTMIRPQRSGKQSQDLAALG